MIIVHGPSLEELKTLAESLVDQNARIETERLCAFGAVYATKVREAHDLLNDTGDAPTLLIEAQATGVEPAELAERVLARHGEDLRRDLNRVLAKRSIREATTPAAVQKVIKDLGLELRP